MIGVETQGQFKTAIAADHFFLTVRQFGASEEKPFASGLFLIVGHTLDGNAAEALFLLRMGGSKFCIQFHSGKIGVRFLNVSWEFCEQLILQTELLALMIGFQNFQLCDLHIEIHLLFNQRISCAQCLNFRIGQCLFIHIIAGANWGF